MLKRIVPLFVLLMTLGLPLTPAASAETPPAADRMAGAETANPNEPREHQLLEFDAASAIWVLVIFAILLIVLYSTAWKNVLGGLKAREQRIRTDIADAEAARVKAEAALREFNAQLATAEERARETIAKATAEGDRVANQIRTNAVQEAEDARERATRDIETARNQAMAEIYEQAATLATSVAEKILHRNLNPDDQRALVTESLQQMQGAGKN